MFKGRAVDEEEQGRKKGTFVQKLLDRVQEI